MQMRRWWTIYETLFLAKYAGAVPLRMLAADLRRTPQDVAEEAARLELSLEYAGTPLYWCDECANWRVKLDASGRCRVCRKRELNQRNESKIAVLLAALPPDVRETYADTEAERGCRKREPKPSCPDTRGMAPRDAVAAESAHLAALDDWEYRQEHRRGKAVQKRKERIAAKVREREEHPKKTLRAA